MDQPNDPLSLEVIGDRLMMHAWYRNQGGHEVIVVNHTVNADGNGKAGVRWYEIRKTASSPAAWSIYQQGTYSPDGDHRWMGSIAMDHVGNIAIGYSVSSLTQFPSIRYALRQPGDPLGSMGSEESLVEGGSAFAGYRWGDYSSMTVDPVDDCTFWYTPEYIPATATYNWKTRIAAFRFPECTTAASGSLQGQVSDALSGLPLSDALVTGQGQTASFSVASSPTGGAPGYSLSLPAETYTVQASKFGYAPASQSNISILADQTTTLNFALQPLPTLILSGTLSDSQTGWPLYASLSLPAAPTASAWSDPQTGLFSLSIPAGVPVTLTLTSFAPGYPPRDVVVGPFSQPGRADLTLSPDLNTCLAMGYLPAGSPSVCQPQTGGLVVGQVSDANTALPLAGALLQTSPSGTGFFTLSQATPADPAQADGYYSLFVPQAGAVISATLAGYAPQTSQTAPAAPNAGRVDFALPAGRLALSPLNLSATLLYDPLAPIPAQTSRPLTLTNNGSAPLTFTLQLNDPLYAPASLAFRRQMHEPSSDLDAAPSSRPLLAPLGAGSLSAAWDLQQLGGACPLGVEFVPGTVTGGDPASRGSSLDHIRRPNKLRRPQPAPPDRPGIRRPDQCLCAGYDFHLRLARPGLRRRFPVRLRRPLPGPD